MQDYLAKPVKGKLLEKMLVKWALENHRRKLAKTYRTGPSKDNPSATAQKHHDQPQIFQLAAKSETTAPNPAWTAELDRLHFESNAALAKSSESDETRTLRRIEAEELASNLRDDKLLSLTGGSQIHRHDSYQAAGGPTHALTQENMQKLAHEQDAEPAPHRKPREQDASSGVALESQSRSRSAQRPSLTDARWRESERTVTPQLR